MSDDEWRTLAQAVERARAAVLASRGMDASADSQIGPRLAHRRAAEALSRAMKDAIARGDAPS